PFATSPLISERVSGVGCRVSGGFGSMNISVMGSTVSQGVGMDWVIVSTWSLSDGRVAHLELPKSDVILKRTREGSALAIGERRCFGLPQNDDSQKPCPCRRASSIPE